jgi:hypothetical protein
MHPAHSINGLHGQSALKDSIGFIGVLISLSKPGETLPAWGVLQTAPTNQKVVTKVAPLVPSPARSARDNQTQRPRGSLSTNFQPRAGSSAPDHLSAVNHRSSVGGAIPSFVCM